MSEERDEDFGDEVEARQHRHRMTDASAVCEFCLAGNARITLVSMKSGHRYTYRVKASKDGAVHFVSVLTGSDNEASYSYAGIIKNRSFKRTAKSRIAADAPSMIAFMWAWERLEAGVMPTQLEVWHEGRCGRCGRALTVPESIERGIGPDCAQIMHKQRHQDHAS